MMKHNRMIKDETTARVLEAARAAWERGSELRAKRDRYKRFTYGDQWSDMTTDMDGNRLTEYELAVKKGSRPMTNNLIRRLVKCVVGRYRMGLEERGAKAGELAGLYSRNSLEELDSRMLEEFLISGCAIQRIVGERREGGEGVWVDNVSPRDFFVNRMSDPRGSDIELVGMIHRMSMAEVVMRFAHGDRQRGVELRKVAGLQAEPHPGWGEPGLDNRGRCLIVEVWTLEAAERCRWHDRTTGRYGVCDLAEIAAIDEENRLRRGSGCAEIATRWEMTTSWRCRWIAPDGTLLDSYLSPYGHGSHPFAVKLYPLTDGEVHSLVEDVIDQQLYVNRLITLIDHIMGTSAKGALLFPIDQKDPTMSWQEVARIWSSPDGILPYRGVTDRVEPKQITTNATDIGARELLQLEMQMFEDVSGVSNALMGKVSGGGNVGAERYDNEVRNALVAISDLLKTYESFISCRDEKMLNTVVW